LSKTHRNTVSVGFKFTRFVKKNWWGLKGKQNKGGLKFCKVFNRGLWKIAASYSGRYLALLRRYSAAMTPL
jgi:hypothetical protein